MHLAKGISGTVFVAESGIDVALGAGAPLALRSDQEVLRLRGGGVPGDRLFKEMRAFVR